MCVNRCLSITLQVLLVFVILSSMSLGVFAAQPSLAVPFRVAVMAGETPTNATAHLTDLLWHLGYPFDYLNIRNGKPNLDRYSLLILYREGFLTLNTTSDAVSTLANYPGSLLWIAPGIDSTGDAGSKIFGVQFKNEDNAQNLGVAYAISGTSKTAIVNETVTQVELSGATVDGYFIDNSSSRMFPAETHIQRSSGNFAYYFAYDVSDWWKADPDLPWSRPAILVSAIRAALAQVTNVLLRPYPENTDTMFIMRIEDVDSIHNSPEWISRAQAYLQASLERKIPLTVALIPDYVDPSTGWNIPINADSATPTRDWLRQVIVSGGTIIQHGYTHQYGPLRSGAGTEFLLNGTWMNYNDQLRRIEQGKELVQNSLSIKVIAFEAPHYKANNDTIRVMTQLGYRYFFDDPNSPFFGFRASENGGPSLLVFPETLSYIPLNASMDFENWVKASVDQLLGIGGIMLQYNHLYDDSEYNVGVDTMKYATQNAHVWTPTVDAAGRFELDRAKSYTKFNVTTGSEATITLGAFQEHGLTLSISGGREIRWVKINGEQWSLFGKDYVILPPLPSDTNSIAIGFDEGSPNQTFSMPLGLVVSAIAAVVAFPFAKKLSRGPL